MDHKDGNKEEHDHPNTVVRLAQLIIIVVGSLPNLVSMLEPDDPLELLSAAPVAPGPSHVWGANPRCLYLLYLGSYCHAFVNTNSGGAGGVTQGNGGCVAVGARHFRGAPQPGQQLPHACAQAQSVCAQPTAIVLRGQSGTTTVSTNVHAAGAAAGLNSKRHHCAESRAAAPIALVLSPQLSRAS